MASRTSPRPAVRRRLASAALLLAAPGLAACGFGAQTDQPYQPSVGSNASGEGVDVLGATIVVAGQDAAQSGTFSAGLVNGDPTESTELTSVISEDGEHEITLLAPVEIGPEAITNLAETGAVLVEGDLTPGGYVRLVLTFANGDEVSSNVPVVNNLEEFADVVAAEPESTPSEPETSPSAEPSAPVETPSAGPSSAPSEGEG